MNPTTDHPRIRGEHLPRDLGYPRYDGSSPHTRGAREIFAAHCASYGIIPAYAGSTAVASPGISSSWDHPRIRGEHFAGLARDAHHGGSSPHTRGAHPKAERGLHRERIIPAYAGSTAPCRQFLTASTDHPRIRGEHRHRPTLSCHIRGSSPHTRGAPLGDRDRRRVHGIIPAYAGSTPAFLPLAGRVADHPRIRGEHHTSTAMA